jgi:hypothetical protein
VTSLLVRLLVFDSRQVQKLLSFPLHPDFTWDSPSLLSNGCRDKSHGNEAWSVSNPEVKKTWSCMSVSPYIFMEWSLITHRKYFNFHVLYFANFTSYIHGNSRGIVSLLILVYCCGLSEHETRGSVVPNLFPPDCHIVQGRAIAQTVSRWFLTAADRVRTRF